jgi:hypothetical protein
MKITILELGQGKFGKEGAGRVRSWSKWLCFDPKILGKLAINGD